MFNFLKKIADEIRLSFLNRTDSPSYKQNIKKSEVNGDIVARDKVVNTNTSAIKLSNNEKRLLKLLYLLHKDNINPRIKITEAHNELQIKDGTFVGDLNESKAVSIQGEFYVITTDGLRYIENLSLEDLSRIVLPKDQRERDLIVQKQLEMFRKNRMNKNNSQYE